MIPAVDLGGECRGKGWRARHLAFLSMTEQRRAEIAKILEDSGACFSDAAKAVPEEHHRTRPAQGRWSVIEVVEHVALAENGMFRLLSRAAPVDASLENPAKEAILASKMANRKNPGEAPERARPTGRFERLSDALSQFTAAREHTIRFAKETDTALFCVAAAHPLFGPVNGYELLLIMAGHSRRHADQIVEIKRSLV